MAVTSALVLYAVVWFMVLFVVLPFRRRTQGDDGDITPGTPAGAPTNFNLRRTVLQVSVIALVIWAAIAAVIIWGGFSIRDFDLLGRTRTR